MLRFIWEGDDKNLTIVRGCVKVVGVGVFTISDEAVSSNTAWAVYIVFELDEEEYYFFRMQLLILMVSYMLYDAGP